MFNSKKNLYLPVCILMLLGFSLSWTSPVSAAAPDPDCGGSDSVSCRGATVSARISWEQSPIVGSIPTICFSINHHVYLNGSLVATVHRNTTSYDFSNLSPNMLYNWEIKPSPYVCSSPFGNNGSVQVNSSPHGSFRTGACANSSVVNVIKAGTGTGIVTSKDARINCGSTCTRSYPYASTLTLHASESTGSSFVRWTGYPPCENSYSRNCSIGIHNVNGETINITAVFDGNPALSVVKTGTGTGTVRSLDGHINCGSSCFHSYSPNSDVTLQATATGGSTFAGWRYTGTDIHNRAPCTGVGDCDIDVTAGNTHTVEARFDACTPNCSCANNLCSYNSCSDGCGGVCMGQIVPDCSNNADHCVNTSYTDSNGCICTGTRDCSWQEVKP